MSEMLDPKALLGKLYDPKAEYRFVNLRRRQAVGWTPLPEHTSGELTLVWRLRPVPPVLAPPPRKVAPPKVVSKATASKPTTPPKRSHHR